MARSAWRRIERIGLGVVFGLIAWFLERRVLKAIRRRGGAEPRPESLSDSTSELERPPG